MEASPAQEVEVAEEAEIDKCANKNVSGRGRGRGRGRGKATCMKRRSAATPNSPKRVSFKRPGSSLEPHVGLGFDGGGGITEGTTPIRDATSAEPAPVPPSTVGRKRGTVKGVLLKTVGDWQALPCC